MSNTSRRTSLTYPNGRVVNLDYGSTGWIDDLFSLVKSAAISGESGNKVEYTRAGLGRYIKIAYPQPAVEMSMTRPGGGSMGDSGDPYDGYDRFSRVQEMRWQNSSAGTPIDAWQWGYNEASNRTWKKNLVAASGQDEAYGYDGLYQVILDAVGTLNTNRTAVGGVPGEEEDFTYDPTGNWLGYRKDANGSAVLDQSRSNNQDNQLTQIDGSSALLSYDRAGNATKTAPGTNGDWSKSYQPVWDAWNRLVEVKDENGTTVQKNAYDGLSRRLTKESASVVTHTYWSDRWKPLEERIGSATTASRSYLWGERPGHRDELVLRDRDTDGNGTLDERLYATMDYFNGTAVLNTSGVVQERYAYSAFGVRRIMAADFTPRSTSNYAWDFGYQGQFRDSETGWSNYGYRFYVPLLGRWINRDIIEERDGINLYSFGKNNPSNELDRFGLFCNPLILIKIEQYLIITLGVISIWLIIDTWRRYVLRGGVCCPIGEETRSRTESRTRAQSQTEKEKCTVEKVFGDGPGGGLCRVVCRPSGISYSVPCHNGTPVGTEVPPGRQGEPDPDDPNYYPNPLKIPGWE
ncbi:MAG: RHS repeat-associated core domain-containing protein [Verrucomicrobiae bacterium]|nr:RHS repeat-associated core domain-containing protein [Verrucomicrobiae bacterium]